MGHLRAVQLLQLLVCGKGRGRRRGGGKGTGWRNWYRMRGGMTAAWLSLLAGGRMQWHMPGLQSSTCTAQVGAVCSYESWAKTIAGVKGSGVHKCTCVRAYRRYMRTPLPYPSAVEQLLRSSTLAHAVHPTVYKPAMPMPMPNEVPSYVNDVPEPQRPPLRLRHALEFQLVSPLAGHHAPTASRARKACEGQGTAAPRPRATQHASHDYVPVT